MREKNKTEYPKIKIPKKEPKENFSKNEKRLEGSKNFTKKFPTMIKLEKSKIVKISPIIILLLSILTRFLFFGYPDQVVFDEVHFGKFVLAYLNEKSFFDIHPPFGKLIIAYFAEILNFKIECPFEQIGQNCPKKDFLVLRFLPTFFSALFVFIFYEFLFLLTNSRLIGIIGSFLLLFENAFLVQGRFILLDIFVLFFGILGLYFYLIYEKNQNLIFLIFSSISLAFSFSTKWTGGSFLFLTFFILLFKKNFSLKEIILPSLLLILFFIFTYSFLFWVHFSKIPNIPEQAAFVGYDFDNLNFFEKLKKINWTMFSAEKSLETASHPYQSQPFEWLLMEKPIFYWFADKKAIFLSGNLAIAYFALISLLFLIISIFSDSFREKFSYSLFLSLFFFLGFLSNFLPFFSIFRPLFLYHFLPAYLFLIANLAFILRFVFRKNKVIFLSILIIILVYFFKALPLTYGI